MRSSEMMNALAGAHLAAGVNQRFPGESVGRDGLGQEDFDFSSRAMLAAAVEAGRQNAGIVEDEAVVGFEVGREIAEDAVFPLAGGAIDHEHPRRGAVGQRFLGDEIVGEVVVEVGQEHFKSTVNWKHAERHASPSKLETHWTNNEMRILGIESSCDETAAAVVEDGSRILSSVVSSQMATHSKYGGVVPELASREHLRAIVPAVRLALEESATRVRGSERDRGDRRSGAGGIAAGRHDLRQGFGDGPQAAADRREPHRGTHPRGREPECRWNIRRWRWW